MKALRILLVDDMEDNRILVLAYLSRQPHEVRQAADGEAALRMLQEEKFDLVLMDLHMPGLGGLETTRRIRAREKEEGRPRVPVIALTASAVPEEVEEALAAGCDAHLAKPVKRAVLIEAIGRYALP